MVREILIGVLLAGNVMASDSNKQKVIKGLLKRGISPGNTIALAANIHQETGGTFDPGIKQGYSKQKDVKWFKPSKGGRGTGLVQWDDRRFALRDFAKKRSKPWSDMDTQLDFIIHELEGKEKKAYKKMNKFDNVLEKTVIVAQDYERAGKPHMRKRLQEAEKLKDESEMYVFSPDDYASKLREAFYKAKKNRK